MNGPEPNSIWLAISSIATIIYAVATIVLVVIIYKQITKQTTATIETAWMPEVIHNFAEAVKKENRPMVKFRRNRPWFPEIIFEVDGKKVGPLPTEVRGPFYIDSRNLIAGCEYHIYMPKEMRNLLYELKPKEDTYSGKVSLIFKSNAGNEYRYLYRIDILRKEDSCEIKSTDLLSVETPWKIKIKK